MTNVKVDRKSVISLEEIEKMFSQANELKSEYQTLRAKALASIFYKTGKRREEVATLEMSDVVVRSKHLSLTFTVVKKRKKNVSSRRREKAISLQDAFADPIIKYYNNMQENHPKSRYLFPSIKSVFGHTVAFDYNNHLSGRQILRIIKQLDPQSWCHLFRETMGATIVREDPSIIAPFKVMQRLDLESYQTAFNYMRRYAVDVIAIEKAQEDVDLV